MTIFPRQGSIQNAGRFHGHATHVCLLSSRALAYGTNITAYTGEAAQ